MLKYDGAPSAIRAAKRLADLAGTTFVVYAPTFPRSASDRTHYACAIGTCAPEPCYVARQVNPAKWCAPKPVRVTPRTLSCALHRFLTLFR